MVAAEGSPRRARSAGRAAMRARKKAASTGSSRARAQPHRDLRARVVEAAPDEAPVVVGQRHHVAGPGVALDPIDGVRVHPGMPEPQRPRTPLAQEHPRRRVAAAFAHRREGARGVRGRSPPRGDFCQLGSAFTIASGSFRSSSFSSSCLLVVLRVARGVSRGRRHPRGRGGAAPPRPGGSRPRRCHSAECMRQTTAYCRFRCARHVRRRCPGAAPAARSAPPPWAPAGGCARS